MRRAAGALAILGLILAGVVFVGDLTAPWWTGLEPGSFTFAPRGDLQELPSDQDCDEPPCERRYAFRQAGTMLVLTSVSNAGPAPITLEGVSQRWLDQVGHIALVRPVSGLDGGDPPSALAGQGEGPFQPVVLNSGEQRIIGLEIETTDDLATACANWQEEGAIGWDYVRLSWRWLFLSHERSVQLTTPVAFQTPTSSDCHNL
jgi:hypothetical protein